MTSFITGSRAYGVPTPKSDVDLVVRVDEATAAVLRRLCDQNQPHQERRLPVRFGRLNLILCTTDDEWAVWRLGTSELRRLDSPSTSAEGKEVFDQLRKRVGILDGADSGGTTGTAPTPEPVNPNEVAPSRR